MLASMKVHDRGPMISDSAQLSAAVRKWINNTATDAEQVALLAAGYLKLIPGGRGDIGLTERGWNAAQNPRFVSEAVTQPFTITFQPNGRNERINWVRYATDATNALINALAALHIEYPAGDYVVVSVTKGMPVVPPNVRESSPVYQKNGALYARSPEVEWFRNSNDLWKCTCGNDAHFVGIDDHGYGGPEACQCGAVDGAGPGDDLNVCVCETTLTQPLTIWREHGEVSEIISGAFTGGGFDAEIHQYDRIYCARCNQPLWIGPDADPKAHAEYPAVIQKGPPTIAEQIVTLIEGYDAYTNKIEYTDTGEAWGILDTVRDLAKQLVEQEAK